MPTNMVHNRRLCAFAFSLSLSHKKTRTPKPRTKERQKKESVFWNRRSVVFLLFLLLVGDLRNVFLEAILWRVHGRDISGGKQIRETTCTLLDIQIVFGCDSARFISSVKRVRTRIPAFFES